MPLEQVIVLGTLGVLVALLIHGRVAPSLAFGGVALIFYLLGYIDTGRALSQFTNTGLVTVLLLMLISVVLDKAQLLEHLGGRLSRGPYRWALFKTVGMTGLVSAFLNNTAVVASMLGPLRGARHHPPSRLLLPMCYAATLGGVLTLIGTSTNLLISSFLVARGLPPLALLDPLPVGMLLFAMCTGVMLLTFPRLLPSHPPPPVRYEDYFLEAEVRPGSRLAGCSVEDNGLRHLGHLYLAELIRDGELIAPVEPHTLLREGDILVFSGDVTRLDLLGHFHGLETYGHRAGVSLQNLVEVVVALDSPLVRRTVKEVDFRARFDAAVIAVRRGAERLKGRIGQIPLEVGDTLILAVGEDFEKRQGHGRGLLVVSRPAVAKFARPTQGLMALAGFALVVIGATLGVFDFLKALLLLLTAFLGLRLVSLTELRRHVPFGLMFIIASALIMSEVMMSTGVAHALAQLTLAVFEPLGQHGALIGVMLIAVLLTELMTNNAAAALCLPIALGVADKLGQPHLPYVMAVLFGASASFLTPYGYQTNLMVMAPGGYRLGDYLRAGLPVSVVYVTGACLLIPWAY